MTDKDSKDAPEFFVSRRGRHVGLHELDLKGIDIDSDTPEQRAEEPAAPIRANRANRTSSTKPKVVRERSPVKRGVIVAIIVTLLVVPLLAAEVVAGQYRSGASSARAQLQNLVSSEVLPLQKKPTISADQLRTVAGKVNTIAAHMCRGGLLDNAAQLYPRAKSAFENCKEAQRNYAALTSSLYELEAEVRYLEALEARIKPVTTPITDEYAVIAAQQTAWRTAADAVKRLSPPERMRAAQQDLSSHMSAVADAWTKLNDANNDHDAEAFTAAEQTLGTEYQAIRETSPSFMTVLTDTQAKISGSYYGLK